MSENRNQIIQVEHLSKRFGGLKAIDDVSIHLNQGEILGLIGANDAGKTTLFNMISGVFPPSEGKILFDGKEIQNMKPHKVCQLGIGRTYQVVQPFTNMSLRKNVMAGALMRHSMKEAGMIADEIIERLGI